MIVVVKIGTSSITDPRGHLDPEAIGELLMTEHIIPLELVSVLLLVAMLGAVVLGHERHR